MKNISYFATNYLQLFVDHWKIYNAEFLSQDDEATR